MTLAEFLLARIAEDEAEARKRMHHAQQNDLTVRDPKHLGQFMPGWWEWREIEAFAARVLAECEAKRSLIDWHHRIPLPYERDHMLRRMSIAYADHPDYRQEWKP